MRPLLPFIVSLGHGDGQCGGGKRHAGVHWVRRDVRTVPNGGLAGETSSGPSEQFIIADGRPSPAAT